MIRAIVVGGSLVARSTPVELVIMEPSTPMVVPRGTTIVRGAPDPAVIKDAGIRGRIEKTRHPWLIRDTRSQITLVLIPPGEFFMGSRHHDESGHRGRLTITRPFYIGQYALLATFGPPNGARDQQRFGVRTSASGLSGY